MTTLDSSLVLSTLDPETAALVREALSLPADERLALDAELDATSIAYSDLVAEITLWRLKDAPGLWARAVDAATAFGVSRQSFTEQIEGAIGRTLTEAMVRRQVRDSDVDTSSAGNTCGPLTSAASGCTMLNLDALMLLGMKTRGKRGDKLALQIKAIIDAFPKLQRVCVRLLRAHTAPRPQTPSADTTTFARTLLDRLTANGAKTLPKQLLDAAMGPQLPGTVSNAEEPDFGDDFRSSLSRAADLLGCATKTLRKRLERVEMWHDRQWVRHGTAKVQVGTRIREEPRHYLHRGALLQLQRRERGSLFSGEA